MKQNEPELKAGGPMVWGAHDVPLDDLAKWLRKHLFEGVMPFWERFAIDPEGGLLTCIGDDGVVLNHDKWLWSQWRAVWVLARIYNRLQRDSKWLELACGIARFCIRHGWLSQHEGWALLVGRNGNIKRGYESIYVDAFAVYGLIELYQATGDSLHLDWAVRTADSFLKKIKRPYDLLPHFPYPIPRGSKPHGIPMMWSLKFAELGFVLGNEKYLTAAKLLSDEIFRDHYDEVSDCLLEFVGIDGGRFDRPEGHVVVPGHVIECMWFQLRLLEIEGQNADRKEQIYKAILRHLELGWDKGAGGLLLAVSDDGSAPVAWRFADAKLWWPHTEALVATLWGWLETGDKQFYDWYQRNWKICWDHFVDHTHGEWRQRLSRDFSPLLETVALPVKDPFHLPRSLILQIEMLERHGLPRVRVASSQNDTEKSGGCR
jgi:N-acylglucosamine 2-epimerase